MDNMEINEINCAKDLKSIYSFEQLMKIPCDENHHKIIKSISTENSYELINNLIENLHCTYENGTSIETFKSLYNILCLFKKEYMKLSVETYELLYLLEKFISVSIDYITFADSEMPPFELDHFEKSLFHGDNLPLKLEYTIDIIHKRSSIRFPDEYLQKIKIIVYRYYLDNYSVA
jgi:hypothetical protein